MQEKSTKPFQQKLDTLEELPDGFSFEPSAVWNKLEQKLIPQKAVNKKTIWFYAAAASVILCISAIIFLQINKKTPQQTVKEAVEQPKESLPAPVITAVQKNETAPVKNFTKNRLKVKQELKVPVTITKPLSITVVKAETPNQIQMPNPAETVIVNITEPVAEITPVASKPPVLKIIHINELMQEHQLEQQRVAEAKRNQKPAEEEISIERNTEPSKPWYKKSKQNLLIKNQ
jgi:hypothetical protein